MPLYVQQYIVLASLVLLVWFLYRDKTRPSLLFLTVIAIYLLSGILSPEDVLSGLANKQIIVIFLLVILTGSFRNLLGSAFFFRWFPVALSPRRFLLKMMVSVSAVSALLNNTPIVAFMIPYVKDWAERKRIAPSRLMIPLSYATILGGMITVVGTSTNLVLNGLIEARQLPVLEFTDFFYLGLLVTVTGVAYLYFAGYFLLPDRNPKLDDLSKNLQEYFVETIVPASSPLAGQTVKAAGLRNLKDIYLVEIAREGTVISPVSPDQVLQEQDILFFSGYVPAIANLVKENKGLRLPDEQAFIQHGHFQCVEAVVPAGSSLAGVKIRESDFRNRFNASIVAVHRQGKRIAEKMGDRQLQGGDLLFLLAGTSIKSDPSELLVLTRHDERIQLPPLSFSKKLVIAAGVLLLLAGVTGLLDLFTAASLALLIYGAGKLLSFADLKRSIDFDLVILLVAALGIGTALSKTGAAEQVTIFLLQAGNHWSASGLIALLFAATLLLTSLISNAAAVAIVFPFAAAVATHATIQYKAVFLAIAFAASADFMTPIGYQTNLMVMGPGNYRFRDYFKTGFPLTLLYGGISLLFIFWYYNL